MIGLKAGLQSLWRGQVDVRVYVVQDLRRENDGMAWVCIFLEGWQTAITHMLTGKNPGAGCHNPDSQSERQHQDGKQFEVAPRIEKDFAGNSETYLLDLVLNWWFGLWFQVDALTSTNKKME